MLPAPPGAGVASRCCSPAPGYSTPPPGLPRGDHQQGHGEGSLCSCGPPGPAQLPPLHLCCPQNNQEI